MLKFVSVMNTTISENLTKATDFAKATIAEWNDRGNTSIQLNYPPTVLMKAQAQYGAENIFMLSSDYHGRYEDDDCYFTYYNNIQCCSECQKYNVYPHDFANPDYKRQWNCITQCFFI